MFMSIASSLDEMDRNQGGADAETLELLEPEKWSQSHVTSVQEPFGPVRRRGTRIKVLNLRRPNQNLDYMCVGYSSASYKFIFQKSWKATFLVIIGILSLGSAVVSIWSVTILEGQRHQNARRVKDKTVSKIAFGSCTAYDYQAQPVWPGGVIPSEPDAWVW